MQKIFNLRCTQAKLPKHLDAWIQKGWRVVSIAGGSGSTLFAFTRKWTIVLEPQKKTA